MNYPKVSIIILNWNGLKDTIECLESLRKITYPNYDVIVVDNGSEGNDAQVLKERFGDYIHVIRNARNYGFAGGANIGMKYAMDNSRLDYVLLLNNDTVVDPIFLTEMVKVAQTDSLFGIVSAKIYFYDDPNRLQLVWGKINLLTGEPVYTPRRIADRFQRRKMDRGQYDSLKVVGLVSGCCFLIKRCVLENIGFLDEGYFFYGEDTDFCFRARKEGYKTVYTPAAKVWHKLGRSSNKVTALSRYYVGRNRFRFMKKHATAWQYRFFLVYFFGFYFWLAAGYHLIVYHSFDVLNGFYRGVRDGVRGSAGAKI
jgi:hypothetical protein